MFATELAYQTWLDYEDTHTELTQEAEERIDRMSARLVDLEGIDVEALTFIVAVERTRKEYKDYYAQWVTDDPANVMTSMEEWALEKDRKSVV